MLDIIGIIRKKAKEKLRKILIVEGDDDRALQAVKTINDEKLAKLVLAGDEKVIRKKAKSLNINLGATEIINPEIHDKTGLIRLLVKLRKHKGMTEDAAKELVNDIAYFSCLLLKQGEVDGVSGSCRIPTAALMRPVFQIIGTKDGASLVNEVGILIDKKNDRILFETDASLNINPTPEELAQMAINAHDCAKGLGIRPYVGLLSFSTKGSGENPILEPIRKTLAIVKERRPDIHIDGEFQVDAAINPASAKRKCPDSEIAGKVNVLVFPNLTAANICLHALGQLSELQQVFGFYMGIDKPVTLMGRSSDVESIINSITICAAQCNMS